MDELARTDYRLPAIPYLRLSVELRSVGQARLGEFKGSLLRGAFGHALRRAMCTEGPGQECSGCELRAGCLYTRCFETFVEDRPGPFLKGVKESPRPYIFEPRTSRRHFSAGDPLEFDLLLLGQAVDLQALVLLALERMARRGLGKAHHPFELRRVSYQGPDGAWHEGYRRGSQAWARHVPSLPASSPPVPAQPSPERLRLRFTTPLRLMRNRSLIQHFPHFRSLVHRMLRRTLDIAHFHVPGAVVDWSFRHLLDRAAAVTIENQDLRVHTLYRYSNRQQRRHSFQGLVGGLTLRGDLGPFLPLLRTAEVIHVGKAATFGLGKVEVGV